MRSFRDRASSLVTVLAAGYRRLMGIELPYPQTEQLQAASHPPITTSDGEEDAAGGPCSVIDGEVAFRNGHFHITDPVGGGLPPVLIPGDDVILTIEGRQVTKLVAVWTGKSVQVRPRLSSQPVREFQIRVDSDRMAAYLSLAEVGPPGYRVKEAGPAHVVSLTAEVLPGNQVNPTMEEIEQALLTAGVVMGIDRESISRALETPGRTTVQVALGAPPQPGVPGRVDSPVDQQSGDNPFGLGLRVEPGQLLAQLTPSQDGQPGYDVSGNRLAPKPAEMVGLVAGYGAVLDKDGTEAIATISGRPVLLQIGPNMYRSTVVPVSELTGPIPGGAKPYRFEGDVVIDGDVGSGVMIQAGGWIWVKGSVHGATLEAGQGIRVERSVKWSQLITRATRNRLVPFQQQFGRILSDLRQMRDYAGLIMNHSRYEELSRSRSFGTVMLLLAQEQFDGLAQRIRVGRQAISDLIVVRMQVDLEAILNALEFRLYSGNLKSIDDLTQFIDAITAATQRAVDILGAGGHNAPVYASILIGSEVDAEGDVIVKGSEQTVIWAKGRVQAKNLRDVRVTSETSIETETAVASTPESMLLRVPAGGQIYVSLAPRETQLQIGDWIHELEAESHNVRIQSDPSGSIKVHSDRPSKHGPVLRTLRRNSQGSLNVG